MRKLSTYQFVPDTEIRVHMGFDNTIPGERDKAVFIAQYLIPHIKQQSKAMEAVFDGFMKFDIDYLQELFTRKVDDTNKEVV